MHKRVVLKLSGEALAGQISGVNREHTHSAFHDGVINRICGEIKKAMNLGVEISLVVGGGNFWRGKSDKTGMDRSKSDQIGMLGTVMNAIYLSESLRAIDLKAVVMTPIIIGTMTELFSKDKAIEYLSGGYVVINAAGLGHPYFSTDTITALRAAELEANCVLYAKNIDGVYDKDPNKFNGAKKYKTLSYEHVIRNSLEVADIAAMNISKEAGTTSLVFALNSEGSVFHACMDNEETYKIGTKICVNIEEEFYV